MLLNFLQRNSGAKLPMQWRPVTSFPRGVNSKYVFVASCHVNHVHRASCQNVLKGFMIKETGYIHVVTSFASCTLEKKSPAATDPMFINIIDIRCLKLQT